MDETAYIIKKTLESVTMALNMMMKTLSQQIYVVLVEVVRVSAEI